MNIDPLFVANAKRKACVGFFEGKDFDDPYLSMCRSVDYRTGTIVIFTRDIGHHTGGWFKNPDYERCYHLSLSFFHVLSGQAKPKDDELTLAWVRAFFGDDADNVWSEPPNYPSQRQPWHYRLFCDENWQPIKTRGEVYSTEFTEKGWKSFSELKYEKEQEEKRRKERER